MKSNFLVLVTSLLALLSCNVDSKEKVALAQTPPMGWNSFDSYGVYLHEQAAMANLEAFAEKLQPFGYEYFVIDAGWFGEFKLREGTLYPAEKHAANLNFNEYGLLQPSKTYFPNGMKPIIDRCHELGLKFGIHLMRGIPRAAYEENTPVKGTEYSARDIADTTSVCVWNDQNYGLDMDKAGAQEFYNSLMDQMAEWGVDFIKYDDLVPYPEEVEGITKAIEQTGRPILLSLSPGGYVDEEAIDFYKKANMLRVTQDIWDDEKGINHSFDAWRKWTGNEQAGFWIDMDMIPFGQLQLMSPKPAGLTGNESRTTILKKIQSGELRNVELLAGKGWNRWSTFTKDQMYTFITLRALAASPLMVGGDLPSLDPFSLELLTDQEMLKCNQNGVMGKLKYNKDGIEVWNTPRRESQEGWLGIFNRTNSSKQVVFTTEELGLEDGFEYRLHDIWNRIDIMSLNFKINPNGVIFMKYEKVNSN